MKRSLKEIRCVGKLKDGSNCRELLGEEAIGTGVIRILCGKCKHVNIIGYHVPEAILNELVIHERPKLIIEIMKGGV